MRRLSTYSLTTYTSVDLNNDAVVSEIKIVDTCYLLKYEIENKSVDMWYFLKGDINHDSNRQPTKNRGEKSTSITKTKYLHLSYQMEQEEANPILFTSQGPTCVCT